MNKILIANRGEIALRVIRACRDLGIPSVAVYSEPDRAALHVRHADEAYLLGPGPSGASYLRGDKIIEIATRCGADAIHPGYGFLSENAAFAEACAEAGITFIGPPPHAMRLLGDKAEARRTMKQAGISLPPGTDLITSAEDARRAADDIGYPVLIKAAGGGGGRGIREVHASAEVENAFQVASQEALQAFGNAGVYVEKYLLPTRHIEVQFIADTHGNVVALGERECSIQRRHQKIIEETPSTAIDADLRKRIMDAAVTAARVANYHSAGTAEFLLDKDKNFYFLEVNTRLQVEHPITEMVTGVDLVRDQILVAQGAPLPYSQDDIKFNGWAIECRITAEDPYSNFLPSTGRISVVNEPSGPGVRVDSSIFDELEVTHFYDSLLAKLCVWGKDRNEAIQRMCRALDELMIAGVKTSQPLQRRIMEEADFRAGNLSTSYLETFAFDADKDAAERRRIAVLSAALLTHFKGRRPTAPLAQGAGNGRSPWALSARPGGGFHNTGGLRGS